MKKLWAQSYVTKRDGGEGHTSAAMKGRASSQRGLVELARHLQDEVCPPVRQSIASEMSGHTFSPH